jgi:guanylate kinase
MTARRLAFSSGHAPSCAGKSTLLAALRRSFRI